jgi:two-component system LytT family sensor kinase
MTPRLKECIRQRNVGDGVSRRHPRFAEWHVGGVERQAGPVRERYHHRVNTVLLFIQAAGLDALALFTAVQGRMQGGLERLERERAAWAPGEFQSMMAHLAVGSVLAVLVFRLVPRVPWPRPFHWRFAARHLIAAPAVTAVWLFASVPVEWLVGGVSDVSFATRFKEMMVIGSFFYLLIAGLSYSAHGARRAAQAEAIAAQTQLATLRSQLQPHFLFNALHTIVQLIHIEPRRAAEAAELVADLLRRTVEEQRDEVPLSEEWQFVSRYLEVEQIRFGERLVVKADLPSDLQSERVPSFALQTLVENAVQHGAAPRIAPTEIAITGTRNSRELTISVRNTGDSHAVQANGNGTGTGLARLRERLTVLYGGSATLTSAPVSTGGYEAVLTVPRNRPNDA